MRRDPERDPTANGGGGEVDEELSAKGRDVQRPMADPRRCLARGSEHCDRADHMPGIGEAEQRPLDVQSAPCSVDDARQQDRGGHADRHEPQRQDEEHRHEHELGRDGKPGADLEIETKCRGVRGDQAENDEP